MKALFAIVAAAAAYLFLSGSAPASGGPKRRKVTGKSGATWFVATDPGLDPGSVTLTVFDSASSQAPIIQYRQILETGERVLIFQSPSLLAATAKADFI
jgi:hypothetical protein